MEQAQIKTCRQILKKNNLHPLKKLGRGGFSIVFLVEKIQLKQSENQLYSVKCINKKQFARRPSLYKYIQQEISTWRELKHRNIVRLVRTFQDEGWVFMLMEYCNRGNIHHVQMTRSNTHFSLQETLKIAGEILEGLEYMHSRNLIHRDIKAENILIQAVDNKKEGKEAFCVKICDLGFVREDDEAVNTFCGTTSYMAPEIFEKRNYDSKVDIWALGVLMYSMLFDDLPFKGLNMQYEIINKCSKGFSLHNSKIKQNSSISKAEFETLSQFFGEVFRLDPEGRPTVEMIKAHRLFKREKSERNTTASSENSEEDSCFQLQKCYFLREILNEVKAVKFLTHLQEISFRFYINKFILANLEEKNEGKSAAKFVEELTTETLQCSKILSANTKKVPIGKFGQYFKPSCKKFNDFKQIYRIVVGHTFSKAHKSITQDLSFRSRIKIKLFCCHVINRVFEKQHRGEIFTHYYGWLKRDKKAARFDFSTFKRWLQQQNPQVLVQTVELMNDRFYKKSS